MNQFIKDTAKAWNLPENKVQQLYDWVGEKVAPQWRSQSFTTLLRKSSVVTPSVAVNPMAVGLTKEQIESKRHTRAQLAEWGVPWPPPKGWKKRLLSRHL